MSMSHGYVDVFDEATINGAGFALALFNADVATLVGAFALPVLPTLGDTSAPFNSAVPCKASDIDLIKAARLAILRDTARRANAYASVIDYLIANMAVSVDVVVTPGDAALQRLPATFVANASCLAPSSTHHLNGTGIVS